MKKPAAADTAIANLKLIRTTRAFDHAEQADGARHVQPGFARAPEDDLLFALGWPHVRYLIEDHPDDRLTDPAAIEKAVFGATVGLDVPRGIALRRIRAFSSFANGPDGKLRPGALRAMNNAEPMSEDEARTFVAEHLTGRSLGTKQVEIALLLEALVGPEAIAESITVAFERTTEAQLADHAADKSTWAFALGFLLLRASAPVATALRERLKVVLARCPADNVNTHSIANVLDQVLHQSKARLRPDHPDQDLLLHFVDEPAAVVLRELTARSWSGSIHARLVFLGGDPVVEYYKKHCVKVKDAADQKAMVAHLGRIASPGIRDIIETLSESKAKNEARAWLDERRPYR